MGTSFRDSLVESLMSLSAENKSMAVLTPDLAKSLRINEFKQKRSDRFITTGVSEADCLSMAAGLAAVGMAPVVTAFAMFAVVKPFEQIRNAIAYPALNVKIIATHGGIGVGRDGATHQAIEDIAIMRTLPNFTVIVPADTSEAKAAIRTAFYHKGPVYIRLGRDEAPVVYSENKEYVIGKSDILQEGSDVAIIACGLLTGESLLAAKMLAGEGISARVINMSSIKPLDEDAVIKAASETGAIVTAEDHQKIGGLGGAVAETIVRRRPVPMEQIGIDDVFGESGSKEELYFKYHLDARSIADAAKRAIARKKSR